ncbi:MAG: cupredoxin domain-containing protein [Candidatus Eremiobacteraeota bacterium]|nr:cupredoxin domain-containing protein [Candidatus Eremiobacteraeota bacterium]MBV9973291.1 cupredoxin domain-containing protein [Candidatus Eremiobacteraeota bacterium]
MIRTILKALTIAGLLAISLGAPMQRVSAHPSIDVAAANWKFTPDVIKLHVGETTALRLTSTEGVHGIKSEELGIPQTTITPGKFVTVEVTPKKAGTYVLHCAVICGPGHEKMALTIKVEKD